MNKLSWILVAGLAQITVAVSHAQTAQGAAERPPPPPVVAQAPAPSDKQALRAERTAARKARWAEARRRSAQYPRDVSGPN
ncbi:MAG: hypothetical protein JWQ76_5681 [Ramlibacter sp.]|nr:hypothetical protein [Ramlibacter sp.]